MALVSLSGGLVYHLRALRHRDGLWAPFRQHIGAWLQERLPPGDELILVGPSAGHCLPLAHLARYTNVLALEPDPLARRLLRARLRPSRVDFERRDLLVAPLLSGKRGLEPLFEARPHAAVLFCNVLGQLSFGLSDEQSARFAEAFRRRVLPLLEGRRWASFHDRWSLTGVPDAPPEELSFASLPSDEELGTAWFAGSTTPVSVFDHGTERLFPADWPRRYFGWQRGPRALHLVEGVSDGPAQLGSAS